MPIVKVIRKCLQTAEKNFEEHCSDINPKLEFSWGAANDQCTHAAYEFYQETLSAYSRAPYLFELMDSAERSGKYQNFDDVDKDWCQQWGEKKIDQPNFADDVDDVVGYGITADRVMLESDGLSWDQWALVGGVVVVAGAATLLSGGTGAAPAAAGGALVLNAAGVGVMAGALAFFGFSAESDSLPAS